MADLANIPGNPAHYIKQRYQDLMAETNAELLKARAIGIVDFHLEHGGMSAKAAFRIKRDIETAYETGRWSSLGYNNPDPLVAIKAVVTNLMLKQTAGPGGTGNLGVLYTGARGKMRESTEIDTIANLISEEIDNEPISHAVMAIIHIANHYGFTVKRSDR